MAQILIDLSKKFEYIHYIMNDILSINIVRAIIAC